MSTKQKQTSGDGCAHAAPGLVASELPDFIKDHKARFYAPLEEYLAKFAAISLEEAIHWAALCQDPQEPHHCHPHQRRVKRVALEKFESTLIAQKEQIRDCHNFEALHDLIMRSLVSGVGPLALYDIALRISAKLNIRPERFVYTHRGAQIPNASNLRDTAVPYDRFNPEFAKNGMTSWHVENFLCCYHDRLNKIRVLKAEQ